MNRIAATLAIGATALLAAGPAFADMTIQFRNDSQREVNLRADNASRTLAPSGQDSVGPTPYPVVIEIRAQDLTVCSGTAVVTEAPAPLPANATCAIELLTFHAITGVTCKAVPSNPGGKDCSITINIESSF